MKNNYEFVVSTVIDLLSIIVAILGIIYIAKQLADNRRFIKTQFISELEDRFSRHYPAYINLLPKGKFGNSEQGSKPSNSELAELLDYLGYFEKIKILLDNQTIDLPTIDKLLSYRFFLITNNRMVQREILFNKEYQTHFSSIFLLYIDWENYRTVNKLIIPFIDNDLIKQMRNKNFQNSTILSKASSASL